MPRKYVRKQSRRPRRRRPKKLSFRSNFRMADYHQYASDSVAFTFTPSTANRLVAYNLTQLAKGDLLPNRNSNLIYVKNVQVRFALRNTLGTARGFRVVLVQLRGSSSAADTSGWTDLLMTGLYGAVAPDGTDHDGIRRVNQNEWRLISDKRYLIQPLQTGTVPVTSRYLNIPVRKYVSYPYNSNTPRKGSMFLILMSHEAPGVAASATGMVSEHSYITHYHDVNRVAPLPK